MASDFAPETLTFEVRFQPYELVVCLHAQLPNNSQSVWHIRKSSDTLLFESLLELACEQAEQAISAGWYESRI